MYKHVLLPTDGSTLSERAVIQGIELARQFGARVTALHVSPRFHVLTYRTDMLEDTRTEFEEDSKAHAERHLGFVSATAAKSQVPCRTVRVQSDDVAQAILDLVQSQSCDLVVMASHGRKGVARLLLGSETHHVLVHSAVPVLVCR
jgi:nucleotide-binding universal stress UspA family protein